MFRPNFLLRSITGAFYAIGFFATLYTIWVVGPPIETRFFPVVSKLQILSMERTPEGYAKLRAGFTKLRNCEYVGISWYVGNREASFERVAISLMRDQKDTGSPNRPLGYQRAGPWIVAISPEEVKAESFVRLSHVCHPFWVTYTDFYP